MPSESPRRLGSFSARAVFLATALCALLTLCSSESRAEQFILFDATFTYTWDNAINSSPSKSHYYVNEGNWLNKQRPVNWVSPINYRNGTVHIRTEVIEKPPGTQQAGWALCYVANSGGYGCPYTDYYTKTGVYEKNVSMTTFYNNATLQWDRGVKQCDLIYTINGSGSGHISNFPALKDLVTPTKVRITMVQVSAGATYDPSILGMVPTTPEPARDGGATEAGGDSADAPVDAGTTPEVDPPPIGTGGAAGGAGGNGGSGGSIGGSGGVAPPPPPVSTGGTTGTGGSAPPSVNKDPVGGGCTVAATGGQSRDGRFGGLLALGLIGLVACSGRGRRMRG
jgi:hypothetical protein